MLRNRPDTAVQSLLATALCVTIAACGGGEKRASTKPKTAEGKTIESADALLKAGKTAAGLKLLDPLLCTEHTDPAGTASAFADEAEERLRAELPRQSPSAIDAWIADRTISCGTDAVASWAQAFSRDNPSRSLKPMKLFDALAKHRPSDRMVPIWKQHALIAAETGLVLRIKAKDARITTAQQAPASLYLGLLGDRLAELIAITEPGSTWVTSRTKASDKRALCRALPVRRDALAEHAQWRRKALREATATGADPLAKITAAATAAGAYVREGKLMTTCCGDTKPGSLRALSKHLNTFCTREHKRTAIGHDHHVGLRTLQIAALAKHGKLDPDVARLITSPAARKSGKKAARRAKKRRKSASVDPFAAIPPAVAAWMNAARAFVDARRDVADPFTTKLRYHVQAAIARLNKRYPPVRGGTGR